MNKLKVGIVGAGIQGISNALFLQKKGFDVTIFDRENPGSPVASYGNAGHFSPYASLSLNRTDILLDVPAMLMSSTGPLALKWNYVPKMIPWFIKFILNTSKNKMMHTAKNMHQILDLALPAYDELFNEINIDEPPYDIIGKGEPTIGSKPKTMLIFITTYIKIDVPKL